MTALPRIGFGFDSHAFGDGGALVLGGLRFDGVPALKGHSDGDAVLHAVVDSLLGAAALGDIGDLFPDTDPRHKGADSRAFLTAALERVAAAGGRPHNIDITLVGERPRLSSRKKEMASSIAAILGMPADHVNVKAKTPEGLTWFAPQGGIAVWAVATVLFDE